MIDLKQTRLRLRGSFQRAREICRAERAESGLAPASGEDPITMMQSHTTPVRLPSTTIDTTLLLATTFTHIYCIEDSWLALCPFGINPYWYICCMLYPALARWSPFPALSRYYSRSAKMSLKVSNKFTSVGPKEISHPAHKEVQLGYLVKGCRFLRQRPDGNRRMVLGPIDGTSWTLCLSSW